MKKTIVFTFAAVFTALSLSCSDDDHEVEPVSPEKEIPSVTDSTGTDLSELSEEARKMITSLNTINDSIQHKGVTDIEFTRAKSTIERNLDMLGTQKEVLRAAFNLIRTYESSKEYGPLFINEATAGGIPRKATGKVIHFLILNLQQAIIDKSYTTNNLVRFRDVMENIWFLTAKNFPGEVAPPADSSVTYTVKINASNGRSWGFPVMIEERPAIRPTGCYAAPGSYVTVKVPESMVRKGFKIRVNAHTWDNGVRPNMKRFDRVSIAYPIVSGTTVVAHPLGGGIYIEVPYRQVLGITEIQITNAVRSPFYSARSWDKMSIDEWRNVQRKYPAPWADFESDKIMINIPTSWIYNFDNPDITMSNWDKGADAVIKLRGLDPERLNKTLLYMQVDLQMRGSAFFPGYPQTNDSYDPRKDYRGNNGGHYILKGLGHHVAWHELGHAVHLTKFRGEVEAIVNFLYVAVYNQKFGMSLDEAFSRSFGNNANLSLDEVSKSWTVTEEFRTRKEMDHSNSTKNQMRYQHRGYAKYVEIVDLFGWDALNTFWYNQNVQYERSPSTFPDKNNDPVDGRIYNLSVAAGYDLRPLIHFWGIHPISAGSLENRIKSAGLPPSAKIYDKLLHYSEIVPKNNEEFRKHAAIMFPNYENFKPKNQGDKDFGAGWYQDWKDRYNEEHCEAARQTIQKILELYFPDGRP